MHIALLANRGSWYRRDLERAAVDRGHRVSSVPFEKLATVVPGGEVRSSEGGVDLAGVDAVIVRTMPPGSLEQVVFRMNLLAELSARGVLVVNSPRALECAVDKYLTTARLSAAGLPVPETRVCEDAETALAAFDALGGDVVVKPIFGAEGRGILRVSDPDLALRTFRTLERLNSVLYLQRFVLHAGFDTRVLVLEGRILGGMRRSHPHDFRTNVSRQAVAEPVELSPEQSAWALRAAAAVGTHLGGIDLLADREGRGYVIEVNGVPGWQAFSRVTGCDVATALIMSLEQRAGQPAAAPLS